MNPNRSKNRVVLSIALSTWGLGFAVMEGKDVLVDWGMKATKGDKDAAAATELEKLIAQYRPSAFVMEHAHAEKSGRSERIRSLAKRLCAVAARTGIETVTMPRQQIREMFFANGSGTKDAMASMIAERFPEELGGLLPRKRKAWMNQHFRMAIFEAVAVALAFHRASEA